MNTLFKTQHETRGKTLTTPQPPPHPYRTLYNYEPCMCMVTTGLQYLPNAQPPLSQSQVISEIYVNCDVRGGINSVWWLTQRR